MCFQEKLFQPIKQNQAQQIQISLVKSSQQGLTIIFPLFYTLWGNFEIIFVFLGLLHWERASQHSLDNQSINEPVQTSFLARQIVCFDLANLATLISK